MSTKHNDPKNPDLRDNIATIKTNVVGLASDIKDAADVQARVAAEYVQDRVEDLKDSGAAQLKTWERRIAKKPLQYVGGAFAIGWAFKAIFGRRS
jgi:hypothetical protein